MIGLIQNAQIFAPDCLGRRDIWISGGKIIKIAQPGEIPAAHPFVDITPCDGLMAFPGIVDNHVHITGGGGEQGFNSRTSEITADEILRAGVTTVAGVLGADKITRSLENLLAKAKALECEGITTFIYAGSYEIPPVTFTGDIASDMVLVDKVVGVGEIAVADHRSSHPTIEALLAIASQAHMGGLLSAKAGLMLIHLGDGKSGMEIVRRLHEESDLPAGMFLPTHVNRSEKLLRQAISHAKDGGYIDLTCGETQGIPVPEAIQTLIRKGVDMNRVTISSDANGSSPGGGMCRISALYDDVVQSVKRGIAPEIIFPLCTRNAAKRLGVFPRKGVIAENSDADILLLDNEYRIQKLFGMGKLLIDYT
ncbi:MAG: beta-aspartyl-peptidase [Oscillospiraceae bacterium]|nr:beta-aspartyl-peptidase [Oscillospiraceae bacterium]